MIVPDKTIVYYSIAGDPDGGDGRNFSVNHVNKFLRPLNTNHKRDWFGPHFYKCLPLSIGNMQGFVFSVPFNLSLKWDGTESPSAIHIESNRTGTDSENYYIDVRSEFGYGIFTIHFPLVLKTPPGVNLMTIAPPNFPTPGISPMTGVIECDNLKFIFTLNVKIDLIDTVINIPANQPLVGIIPIPRYFCDNFENITKDDWFNDLSI